MSFFTYFRSYWNNSIDIRLLFFNINLDYLLIAQLLFTYFTITLISVFLDQIIYKHYTGIKVLILIFMIFIEPIAFHPINIYASIKGCGIFFRQKEQNGGQVRQGFNNANIEK
jgi:hypothetical protein